jgi:hypothetical protein
MSTITLEIIKSFLGLSVFKRPKISFYYGPIALGAPIFFPRKLNKNGTFTYYKWLGIKLVNLGWKTKWDEYDIRFEWSPSIHLIVLNTQIAAALSHEEDDYWEAIVLYTRFEGTPQERVSRILEKKSFRWTLSNGSVRDTKKTVFKEKYIDGIY